MKIKRINQKSTLVLLLMLFSFSSLIAQVLPSTAIVNSQPGEISGEEFEPGTCNYLHYFPVYTTNLIPHPDQEEFEYVYILPSDASPIFLKYTIGSETGILPVKHFAFMQVLEPSGLSLYGASVVVSINYQWDCKNVEGDIGINFTSELVNKFGEPYPYHLNDSPDGIFSCEVFCDDCADSSEGDDEYMSCLLLNEDIVRTGTHIVDCDICNDNQLPDETEEGPKGFYSNNGIIVPQTEENFFIDGASMTTAQVSPNPFDQSLKIQISSNVKQKSKMMFFNASGKVIYDQDIEVNKGSNQIRLNTDDWQPGIYFGQIKLTDSTEYIKCLKLK